MAATVSMQAAWLPLGPAAPTSPPTVTAPTLAVVGSIVGQHGTVVCLGEATLSDAVDLLVLHDRTAAGVVDAAGNMLGAITENDIMRAYAMGASPLLPLAAWLQSGHARLPGAMLETMTVQPTTPLCDAAARMRSQAGSDFAFRHLVVRNSDGALVGILSSLDLARALCCTAAHQEIMHRLGNECVAEVMKHKAALSLCSASATLGQVLERMILCRQNCVLIAEGVEAHHVVLGVFTTRDVMRAFSEHIPLETNVGHWLRGLQSRWDPRIVRADAPVLAAASLMVSYSIHHLVVISPATCEIVGVLSSSDLAQSIGSAERVVEDFSPRDDIQGD